nr:Chain A, 16S rRNA methyltransferase [Streptoalloteichus tenebrarius]3MQ2_B Chain B, 16S rRNA methyltransferase [Streptoalloteichus tenebrarius]
MGSMRRVVGKRVQEFSDAEFEQLRSQYDDVVLDVGTGDGKHPYKVARQNPSRLVVALDADKSRMEKISAKAAAKPAKGGLPNLLYLWATAERLPPLSGVGELHVLMPWGSLLRGVLGSSPEMLRGMAAVCRPGASFLVALNLHAWRPSVPEVGEHPEPTPDSADEWLAPRYAEAGWKLADCRYLEPEEVAGLETSWTRRLHSSRDRFDVLALTGTISP